MLLGSACTKEQKSTCKSPLLLSFHYTSNTQNEDLFSSSIENIDLFIYDKNSKLVSNHEITKSDLIGGNKYSLNLDQGEYTIVAFGEALDSYQYVEQNLFNTAYISLKRDEENNAPQSINHLFHSMTQQIVVSDLKEVQQPLFFIKNSNHIRIIVENTPNTMSESDVFCSISAINGDYKFDNTIFGNDRIDHTPTPTPQIADQNIQFDCTVLRLWRGDNSHLIVRDQHQALYDGSLSQLLLSKPGTDLDLQDEFEIRLSRNSSDNTVKITVNGWQVIDHNSGL